jgi:hypothetical protein
MNKPSVAGLVDALQPTYAVMRPSEFNALVRSFPETAAKYQLAATVKAEPGVIFENMGYQYAIYDREFRVLRRTRAFEEVVHP